MPGPMYGNPHKGYAAAMFHNRCQKSEQCKGPGCRVHTGKTAIKRKSNRKGRR